MLVVISIPLFDQPVLAAREKQVSLGNKLQTAHTENDRNNNITYVYNIQHMHINCGTKITQQQQNKSNNHIQITNETMNQLQEHVRMTHGRQVNSRGCMLNSCVI